LNIESAGGGNFEVWDRFVRSFYKKIEFLTSTFVIRYSAIDICFFLEPQNRSNESSQGGSLFFYQTGRFGQIDRFGGQRLG
jgi:hypothetical protein